MKLSNDEAVPFVLIFSYNRVWDLDTNFPWVKQKRVAFFDIFLVDPWNTSRQEGFSTGGEDGAGFGGARSIGEARCEQDSGFGLGGVRICGSETDATEAEGKDPRRGDWDVSGLEVRIEADLQSL